MRQKIFSRFQTGVMVYSLVAMIILGFTSVAEAKLAPGKTAVILIEFQNEFCSPDGLLHDLVKDEMQRLDTVSNAVRLMEAASERGCLIVHAPYIFNPNWTARKKPQGIIEVIKEEGMFRAGEWGSRIIDDFKPETGEVVLNNKFVLSAFDYTYLHLILVWYGIKNLIVAGFTTNLCVEGTMRDAYDLGFHVILARDAVASGSEAIQTYVEEQIMPNLGRALTVDECIAEMVE
jgi:nicotinamidase-related amidase